MRVFRGQAEVNCLLWRRPGDAFMPVFDRTNRGSLCLKIRPPSRPSASLSTYHRPGRWRYSHNHPQPEARALYIKRSSWPQHEHGGWSWPAGGGRPDRSPRPIVHFSCMGGRSRRAARAPCKGKKLILIDRLHCPFMPLWCLCSAGVAPIRRTSAYNALQAHK